MNETTIVAAAALQQAVSNALAAAGADAESVSTATRAMMHASLLGIDSHGVRLTGHYCAMMKGGRINPRPVPKILNRTAASAILDADDALGHLAGYRAMALACELAAESGVGAVGVRRSSHLGAAGAYALAGAEAGYIGFATTNTDSMVALFEGAARFHGTNPLAFAAPVPGQKPWLFDMATSSIPMNRVLLHRSLQKPLPEGVAADANGHPATDADAVDMVLPLGGTGYGYKGAGLAGVATLLSAVLTGTTLDPDFIPMYGTPDDKTPRNMGHFVLALSPDHFAGRAVYESGILRYLDALRGAPAREGGRVMAPGDREWETLARREREGIPIDPDTARFLGFA
ncbi:Ldh family oxidoreductase [Arsenicitalea aurantiaca]|uniref:Ldh family oxidoreductase n=1 Tax=Arsenicitalea aurantiaca TaxID=1783274 RepID=A0A433XKZ8_9HYPH|nr:Ldh family oxidoreductase [Arsenicitalea aurantiaca]RUT34752.1 Ldh family oxidoreductase [Arsenicitalea aurantiaca]